MKKRLYTVAVVLLLIFSFTMFFLTRFNKSSLIAQDGFFVSGEKLDEVLLSPNKVAKTGNVNLEKVSSNDTFYTNVGRVFVGEEKKVEVNTIYPMYVNNGLGVVNLDRESTLINRKFEKFETYENFTVTGGKLYNFGDLEQADYEDYILLELSNGTYVNLLDTTITTSNGTFEIPLNSIINFQEEYFNYYYFNKDGKLVYKIIDGISLSDEISFKDFKYDYETFLVKLGKREAAPKTDKTKEDEQNGEDEYLITDGSGSGGGSGGATGAGETKYIAPKVTSTNFTANVYSAKSVLTISDPSRVIVGGINYQFYVNDKVFLRKTFITGGTIEVIGLVPNTTFKIIGNYKYYNEESKKMEMTFFEQDLTTLGVDNLEPISLGFRNGEVYPNKIEITDMNITSDLESETIKGINKAIILINGEQFSIPTGSLSDLMLGKSVTYTSPAKIASNMPIDYTIKFLDAYSNEIKLINNTGNTRTSKNSPSASVKITSSAVNSVEFAVTLKNLDDVNIDNYRYTILKPNGEIFEQKALDKDETTNTVTLKNLDPNTTYSIMIYGDYDNENGQGTMHNQVIGEGKFTTAPLSSLGFFRVVASPEDLTDNSVTITSQMDVVNVSQILIELLNSLKVTVTDEEEQVVYTKVYKGDELNSIKAGDEFVEELTDLSSVSTYNITYEATVKQGSVTETVTVLCSLKNFKTYKRAAEVQIQNEFVTSSMIDFDVRVIDLDAAIGSGRVLLEIRDSKGDLVGKEYLNINDDYVQLTYNKLNAEEMYTFSYIVEDYNIGYNNSTYESDYVLLKKVITTEEGVSGSIELIDLLRDITGINLFNIEDYDRIRKEGNTGYKEYDIKNNTVMFGAKNGYVNYSYFLPEALNKGITIRFQARYNKDSPNTAPVYIGNGFTNNLNFEVTGLTYEWQEYTFSFKSTNNYIGFIINETSNQNKKTTVDFKDIQIIAEENYDITGSNVSVHESSYKFTDAVMHAGNESMPDWRTTGTVVGNYGEGHARITDLTTNKVTDINYSGAPETYQTPSNGNYKIELWGAAGGDNTTNNDVTKGSHGGRGAYTAGTISLNKGINLYVYVGGKGAYGSGKSAYNGPVGGWNGGGNGANSGSGSGGGSTDVRLTNGDWKNEASLKSRIMVAGAGGGTDDAGGTVYGSNDGSGGVGGGLVSQGAFINGVENGIYGAGQTFGYAFGYGGNATNNTDTGGGGGGYFGGLPSNNSAGGGGGGSSYISGYNGCVAYAYILKPLEKYNAYTENNQYQGTFSIDIYDRRDEIITKDWYVRIYKKGEYVGEYQYDLVGNQMEDVIKTFGFDKNMTYTATLSIKIRDRYYDLDSIDFDTQSEIRAIRTTNDFYGMHSNGRYIVLNDLDFRSINSSFGYYFFGQIDFQGHKVIRNVNGGTSALFSNIRSSGIVKNIVVDYYLDNPSSRNSYYGMVTYNYGTFDNIIINVLDSTRNPNYVLCLCAYANYGTIQNFIVNAKVGMSALAAAGYMTWSNQGALRNGYVYGENIYAYHQNVDTRSRKDIGVLTGEATSNSRIEAVYSLVSVEKNNNFGTGDKENVVGNMVGFHNTGHIGNSYSVEFSDSVNTNIVTQDPNVGKVSGIRFRELYYVSDKTYGGAYSSKVSKLALYDKTFQNQVLNIYNGFDVDTYVDLGYFPQLLLNDCMPKQDWIELPKVTDADLIDVTSIEEIENFGDSATVKLHINNPANETITKVVISDINKVDILDQVNTYGKTELTVKLSQPQAYKSKYYVDSIYIKPAYGTEYVKSYGKNERSINIDLYYPIKELNDWKVMVSAPSQNYALMTDLDFKNAAMNQFTINGTFSAKFDGRGHTIKNINVTSSNAMFNTMSGTIKNLFIENYNKNNKTSYGGFIYQTGANAVIDNVHMTKVYVHARDRIGGLVGYANQATIRNCSVTDFVPMFYKDQNGTKLEEENYEFDNIYVGAIAGYSYLTFIENTYAQDVDIEITDALSTFGVGGMVGRMDQGTLRNSYATGSIQCNSVNVGGLVGQSSATINNVWSYVDISTELDYVGGIVGKSDNSNVGNTLVFGAVYSTYVSNLGNNIHRTTGNALDVVQSNYAWDKQKYYGLITGESSAEVLLSAEQLEEESTYIDMIGFDSNFDYSEIADNVVPKIINPDTGDVLPNQKDVVLKSEMFDIIDIQIDKTASDANLSIEFQNPDQFEVTAVEFNYLRTSNETYSNFPSDGTTIARVHVTPDRFYDSYTITKIKYKDKSGEEKEYNKIVRVELQFYKILNTYEVWQNISKKYAENYRLTADIDFTGKANVNCDVMIGRLEGQTNESGVNYKIMNFTRAVTASKTGFIKKLTTTLKNVTFEGFNITSNSSLSYINLIYLNYADIENVQFNNITINTPKSSYVAPIGYHRGQNINQVSIDHNNITGTRNVAGLLAYTYNTSTADISAADCTIKGTSTMVGGIIAEKPWINAYNSFRYSGVRMHVTGQSYVGGLFGQGGAYGATIEDSDITGLAGGSYIGGMSGYNDYENDRDHVVRRCTITAAGNYVGGLHGRALHFYNGLVIDSSVTQTDASKTYVGGAEGFHDGYTHSNIGVVNTTITNAGDYTGGLEGRLNSGGALTYSFTSNVNITGRNYVGGICGYGNTARVYQNVTNVNINATGNYVGGAFGYIASVHATDSSYSAVIYEVLIANSKIKGANNVGGFVGKTTGSQLTPAKFYNIIIVADTDATASDPYIGAVNGDDTKLYGSTQLTTFRLYQNNKLNGVTISSNKPSNIASSYLANPTNLKTQSYYTNFGFNTARWDYTNIATYFPRVKQASSGAVHTNQKQLTIPTGNVVFARMDLSIAPIGHELPIMNAYSSGINTINLEFDKTDDFSYFEVYDSGVKVFDQKITDRVFTINYDYQSKLKVVVSDGRNSKEYNFTSGEFRNLTSTYKKKYAYIYQGKILGNVDKLKSKGKFIHIYNNLALTDELEVFDIVTGTEVSQSLIFTVSLADQVNPLFEFDYKDTKINTYYNYSVVEKDGEDIIYENQILVKNGAVEIVDSSLDTYHNMVILDNYSNDNYVSVLAKDGSIYDLKSKLKMPANFSNKAISSMSNNVLSDNNAVILVYKTGKVVVFDYRTGKEIEVEKATEDIGLFEYFKQNLKTTEPLIEDKKSSYKEALDLKDLLTDNPIEENSNGDYSVSKEKDDDNDKTSSVVTKKRNYVTYYNNVRGDYDVIDVSDLLNSDDTTITSDDIVTEKNKIYTSNALVEFYMKESIFEQVFKNVNGLYILGAILIGILTALGLWIRNVWLLRSVEEGNNGKN